jgi:hypothetical protein
MSIDPSISPNEGHQSTINGTIGRSLAVVLGRHSPAQLKHLYVR